MVLVPHSPPEHWDYRSAGLDLCVDGARGVYLPLPLKPFYITPSLRLRWPQTPYVTNNDLELLILLLPLPKSSGGITDIHRHSWFVIRDGTQEVIVLGRQVFYQLSQSQGSRATVHLRLPVVLG